jgi:hypothetical protein
VRRLLRNWAQLATSRAPARSARRAPLGRLLLLKLLLLLPPLLPPLRAKALLSQGPAAAVLLPAPLLLLVLAAAAPMVGARSLASGRSARAPGAAVSSASNATTASRGAQDLLRRISLRCAPGARVRRCVVLAERQDADAHWARLESPWRDGGVVERLREKAITSILRRWVRLRWAEELRPGRATPSGKKNQSTPDICHD